MLNVKTPIMDVTTLSDVSVILPAAGDGLRMNLKQKKQFTKVLGKPLISYTIENFETFVFLFYNGNF